MDTKTTTIKFFAVAVCVIFIILTLGFIWGNSIVPMENSGEASNTVFNKLKPMLDFIFYPIVKDEGVSHHFFRKLAHFSEFFLLASEVLVLVWILGKVALKNIFLVLGGGLACAVIDESIQLLTNRGSAVLDILIDFFGFVSGTIFVVLIYAIVFLINYRKHQKLENEVS
ncbi:MAG: VanZ family protein [Clostridia bacterium]